MIRRNNHLKFGRYHQHLHELLNMVIALSQIHRRLNLNFNLIKSCLIEVMQVALCAKFSSIIWSNFSTCNIKIYLSYYSVHLTQIELLHYYGQNMLLNKRDIVTMLITRLFMSIKYKFVHVKPFFFATSLIILSTETNWFQFPDFFIQI